MNQQQHSAIISSTRGATRLAGALAAAVMTFGLFAAIVDGMSSTSGGQSLESYMAQQRSLADHPLAASDVPAVDAPGAL